MWHVVVLFLSNIIQLKSNNEILSLKSIRLKYKLSCTICCTYTNDYSKWTLEIESGTKHQQKNIINSFGFGDGLEYLMTIISLLFWQLNVTKKETTISFFIFIYSPSMALNAKIQIKVMAVIFVCLFVAWNFIFIIWRSFIGFFTWILVCGCNLCATYWF